MKTHTSDFKNALKGMVVDNVEITYDNTTLGTDEIIDVEFFYEGSLLKTMMKGLTITSTEDIAKDTIINFKYSIYIEKEPPATSGFEDLDFGNYVVVSSEKNEDSNTYTITCYDKLIYSAVDYVDLNLTYPITLGNYLSAICTHLGLTLSTSTFTNSTMEIPSELYLDIGYKFRDVLDEISQATGTSICLNANDEVELRVPTATNDTIDEDLISDLTTKFKEKYGPINTLVLSRSAESDNLYYPSTLPQNPVEIKITDNQILNGEDREDYMAGIASNIFGIEFYQNDFTSPGVFYYDFLDIYNVSIDGTTYNCIMFNDDISIANKTETIHSDIPQFSETDYSKSSNTDRKLKKATLVVDKMENIITATVRDVTDLQNKMVQVEETADSFNIDIVNQQIANATNPLQEQIDSNTSTIEQNSSDISTMQGQITSMNFNFSTSGLSIGSLGDDISSTLNNQGLKIYNLGTLIAIFNKNGAGVNKLIATESIQFQNLLLKKREITWTNPFTSSSETIDVISGFWLKDLIEDLEDLEG